MGTSARQDDPTLRLRYYRETGQDAEATRYAQYLKETGQLTSEPDAAPPAKASTSIGTMTPDQRHAAYRSGTLQQMVQTDNAGDQSAPYRPTLARSFLKGTIPGYDAIVSRGDAFLTGRPRADLASALHDAEAKTAEDHPLLDPAAKIAGAVLPFAAGTSLAARAGLVLPKALAVTGGTLGGIEGATADAENSDDRLRHTLVGAGIGAVTPWAAGKIGAVAQKASAATGLTDLASMLADKVGLSKVANSIGTKGAVNRTLADREAVTDALGQGSETGPAQLLAHAEETRKTAAPLYDAMRNDQTIITDPDLQAAFQHPLMKKAAQWVTNVQQLSGRPMGDPELLHLVKQYVRKAASNPMALPGDGGLNAAEAQALQGSGVLDKITNRLQQIPTAKAADDYFATRMNWQDGFENGMALAGKPLKQSATQAATSSPEAMQAWAQEPLSWKTTRPDLAKLRTDGLDAGHRAGLGDQVRDVPLTAGKEGILSKAPFSTAPDAAARRGMLSTGGSLNDALNTLEGKAASEAGQQGPVAIKPWTWGRAGNQPFDYLGTKKGATALRSAAGTPSAPHADVSSLEQMLKVAGIIP